MDNPYYVIFWKFYTVSDTTDLQSDGRMINYQVI